MIPSRRGSPDCVYLSTPSVLLVQCEFVALAKGGQIPLSDRYGKTIVAGETQHNDPIRSLVPRAGNIGWWYRPFLFSAMRAADSPCTGGHTIQSRYYLEYINR
jgi:hypothetical protein